MKKAVIAVMILAALVACQKKEEPKGAMPGTTTGMIQSMNEMKLLEDAVRQDPKNVNAWIQLGNTLMDSARFQDAVNAYRKALELDPKNVDVRVDMATCYRNSGRPEQAVEEYRKAITINPNHPNAHRNLGVVLAFDMRDLAGGIREFEKYLELAPAAPDSAKVRQTISELKAGK